MRLTKKQFLLLTLAMAISVGRAFCADVSVGEDLPEGVDFCDGELPGHGNSMAASYCAAGETAPVLAATDDRRDTFPASVVREIPVVLGTSPDAIGAATRLRAILLPGQAEAHSIVCAVVEEKEDVLGNVPNAYTIRLRSSALGEARPELVIVFADDNVRVQEVVNATFRYALGVAVLPRGYVGYFDRLCLDSP